MIPLETLRELYEYNYWARDQQLEACARLTSEQFLRPMGNSFSSVRDTLAHLLVVEWIWLERCRGRSPNTEQRGAFAPQKLPSLDAIRSSWAPIEKEVRDFLQNCSDEGLAQPLSYTNFQGKMCTYSLWRTLFHLLNHQTYHRGQITTLLRQLGGSAVETDYLLAVDLRPPNGR